MYFKTLRSSSCRDGVAAMAVVQALLGHVAAAPASAPIEVANGHVEMVTPAFEQFVQEQMDKWHVPGAAISIIDGDNTWAKVRSH